MFSRPAPFARLQWATTSQATFLGHVVTGRMAAWRGRGCLNVAAKYSRFLRTCAKSVGSVNRQVVALTRLHLSDSVLEGKSNSASSGHCWQPVRSTPPVDFAQQSRLLHGVPDYQDGDSGQAGHKTAWAGLGVVCTLGRFTESCYHIRGSSFMCR